MKVSSLRSLAGAALALLCLSVVPRAATAQTYNWQSVRIGGGGYTTGMLVHPSDANTVYVRTDVGGAYRWNSGNNSWTNFTDKNVTSDPATNQYNCVESIAVDPGNVNTLYLAAGGWGNDDNGRIYRSNDKGNTWAGVANLGTYVNGNMDARWGGERLQVDPNNSSVVYYGTRKNGLYKSANGGASFARHPSFAWNGGGDDWKSYGLTWVACDKNGGTTSVGGQTVTRYLYAGVWGGTTSGNVNYGDGGVYRSADGGQSWSRIGGSTYDRSWRGQVSSDGTLWITHGGGVAKLGRGASGFTSVTPPAESGNEFCALAVDPSNPSRVIVGRLWYGFWQPNYLTTNGGGNWTQVNPNYVFGSNAQPGPSAATSSFAFSPSNGNQVWFGDWYSPWRTDDVSASTVTWTAYNVGYELTVPLGLLSVPAPGAAPLLSLTADVYGFRHTSLTANPARFGVENQGYNGTGADFCEADTNIVARVGNNGWDGAGRGGVSTDNGQTFTNWSESFMTPYSNGQVAVGATKQGNGWPVIVLVGRNQPTVRSTNGGANWSGTSGVPSNALDRGQFDPAGALVSDRVDGNKFYLFAAGNGSGTLYRSTDGGANWSAAYTLNYGWQHYMAKYWLRSVPGVNGELYFACDGDGDSVGGLYRLTNSGATWTKIGNVQQARMLGLGKPQSGTTPTLFIVGKANGDTTDALYRSTNAGGSWAKIYNQDTEKKAVLYGVKAITGDRQTFGRVYTASDGRGVWVGDDTSGTPPPTGNNARTGTWAARGDLTATAWTGNLWQYVSVTRNRDYTASFWIKGSGSVLLRVFTDFWGSQITSVRGNATSGWTQVTVNFNSGNNDRVVFNLTDAYGTPGTVYIDDTAVRIGTGTNRVSNPGFESGTSGWEVGTPFSILQNP
jgi:hypothetical protein